MANEARYLVLACSLGCFAGGCTEPDLIYEWVSMRDGVQLATEVHLPEGPGPFSTVLVRTPYGRSTEAYAAFRLEPSGLAVVVQDTRGRFDSEGIDPVFLTDASDGEDTCAWIVSQPWSDGRIAMIGESAVGITGYMAASTGAPGLLGLSAGVATADFYSHAAFSDGVRRYALSHLWLEQQGSLHFEAEMARHPLRDGFWDPVQTTMRADSVQVAAVHTAGWYDIFQQGGLDAFMAYQHQGGQGAAGRQKLIIGPWTHGEEGELHYPEHSEQPPSGDIQDALLDEVLAPSTRLSNLAYDQIPAVQYYVMGDVDDPSAPGNTWRSSEDWPIAAAPMRWYLGGAGRLGLTCPSTTASTTRYTFNPEDPSPTVCGNNLNLDAGPCDQRRVEDRDDVVVFETEVLDAPVEITGRMRAHLFVDIDQPDADLMVRLTDVYPDGRSMLVADGALRLAARNGSQALEPVPAGAVVEGLVDLWSTSIIINTGHRIRMSVSSSNWPRYAVNRNNGQPYPGSVEGETRIVQVALHHDREHASYIELPDPNRSPQDVVVCGL